MERTGSGGGGSAITITEQDGSPSGILTLLKVTNGTLTDNGGGTFSLVTGGGGGSGISSINSDVTSAQTLTVGSAGTDFAIVDNGTGDHLFNLPSASATARGVITTGTQTIAGTKTFSSTITGSISGNAGTATALATGRTISISGDLTYTSPSFDGTANVTAAGTLATVNSNVGSFTNASITVNGKGLVTAASSGTAPVTSITVSSANGFAGSSSGGATPALTLTTTINAPILAGNGTAISAATTTGSGSTAVLATAPVFPTSITSGATSGTTGTHIFKGTTSGTVTLSVADAAGTWTMKLPTSAGSNTNVLTTDGSGNTSWSAAAAGTVTSVASADGSITVTNPTSTVDLAVVKAPILSTARSIGGVSFNGSANITVASATGGFAVSGGNFTSTGSGQFGAASGTNGQITLTGSTSGTGVIKVNVAAGAGIVFQIPSANGSNGNVLTTDGAGVTSWSSAGAGTVTATGGSLTANSVVLGAGTTDTKVVAGITTDGTSVLNLGVNATTIGKVKMFGNTSGDATIQPAAVAGTATVLTLPASTDTLVGRATTDTLTNKRITKRTGTTSSSATPTINTDNVDNYDITAQAAAITSFTTNLSGTPTTDQTLWISITDNGTARAITWGSSFESSTTTLPTTTVTSARLDVGFVWNSATSKWRCVAVA